MSGTTDKRVVTLAAAIEEAAAHHHVGRLYRALELYQEMQSQRPNEPAIHNNLAAVLHDLARVDEAAACYRRALELQPNARVHSNLICVLERNSRVEPAEVQTEKQRWHRLYRVGEAARFTSWPNPRDPDRRLRLGYVSADFWSHSASHAFGAVLAAQDRTRFEITCYAANAREDDRTALLKGYADRWRVVLGWSDTELAAAVRADEIDILVDLSGHTAGNRLPMFTAKPAPVQVTGWGYNLGNGVPEIDYMFSDPVFLPPAERRFFVEHIVDLPCYLAYQPPCEMPDCAPLPALAGGVVTFGCLNRYSKVTDDALRVWARILDGAPGSRLILKDRLLSEPRECHAALARLAALGIAPARVTLRGRSVQREHLATYDSIDLALDPFPENGGITTLEALWMGVPSVVLHGVQATGRGGASILTTLGLRDFIARDADDYVARALHWSADLPALAELRKGLRARVAASPIADAAAYTMMVEEAYRAMWKRWCSAPSG